MPLPRNANAATSDAAQAGSHVLKDTSRSRALVAAPQRSTPCAGSAQRSTMYRRLASIRVFSRRGRSYVTAITIDVDDACAILMRTVIIRVHKNPEHPMPLRLYPIAWFALPVALLAAPAAHGANEP